MLLRIAALASFFVIAASSFAAYTKHEYRIPMRDGRRLMTIVYVPDTPGTHPILLERTPYSAGPYGQAVRPLRTGKFSEAGYIFAFQDVRGRFMSEGEFTDMRPQIISPSGPHDIDESTDSWDTVEFLVKNVPNNNGRVGIRGISYPGGYAALAGINTHPALKAISPQAPTSDWFVGDDFHHNGALFLQDVFSFFGSFGVARPEPLAQYPPVERPRYDDAYRFFLNLGPLHNINDKYWKSQIQFWNDAVRHPDYDEFWQARSVPVAMKNVRCAVLTVGGWFDAEDLWGPLNLYAATERQNPGIFNALIMGPWIHGGWAGRQGDRIGEVVFGPTTEFFQNQIEFPFFDAYLRGDGKPNLPEATIFETGRNRWHRFETWPPKGRSVAFYLDAERRLSPRQPEMGGFDRYISDPNSPVPYEGGKLGRRSLTYMVADQRFAAARADVLAYVTDPLTADRTFAGPIESDLFVSITGTDADFVTKVIDVYPDDAPDLPGQQILIRAEVMRGKYRNSLSNPSPFVPGQIERVSTRLNDICHTFRKGHRIMVQIQSSWFPLVDRNPQVFTNIYTARAEQFRAETITIRRGGQEASTIRMTEIELPR